MEENHNDPVDLEKLLEDANNVNRDLLFSIAPHRYASLPAFLEKIDFIKKAIGAMEKGGTNELEKQFINPYQLYHFVTESSYGTGFQEPKSKRWVHYRDCDLVSLKTAEDVLSRISALEDPTVLSVLQNEYEQQKVYKTKEKEDLSDLAARYQRVSQVMRKEIGRTSEELKKGEEFEQEDIKHRYKPFISDEELSEVQYDLGTYALFNYVHVVADIEYKTSDEPEKRKNALKALRDNNGRTIGQRLKSLSLGRRINKNIIASLQSIADHDPEPSVSVLAREMVQNYQANGTLR